MGLLDGKTAIVTGAARGIGKAIALKFAQEGANIAFTDLVIDENAEATVKEIEALGVKAKGYASNAASFEDTAKVVETVHADFGRIDILMNNAGAAITKKAEDLTMEEWDRVVNVDLRGAFMVAQAVGKVMIRQNYGRIINTISVYGYVGGKLVLPYLAAKGGLAQVTKAVADQKEAA